MGDVVWLSGGGGGGGVLDLGWPLFIGGDTLADLTDGGGGGNEASLPFRAVFFNGAYLSSIFGGGIALPVGGR